MSRARDHGGALDAACARWGGARADWIDLSTGINPVPYPVPPLSPADWTALPDRAAQEALEQAARRFWNVPDRLGLIAAPGASCLIAALPHILPGREVAIRPDTYNEHAAAFSAAGWSVHAPGADGEPPLQVIVHPNNPTGEFHTGPLPARAVIDESFCDTAPASSLMAQAGSGRIILKSFGKFWGLAGLRLGFAIGDPDVTEALRIRLGPWPVAGPALAIATRALNDRTWADDTRARLARDAARLDALMPGTAPGGGCPLFRLCHVADAIRAQGHFAAHRILTRVFPYAPGWLRLGLPAPGHWPRVVEACTALHGTVGGASAQPRAVPPSR